MDQQIERKQSILRELQRKFNEGSLEREEIRDLRQEFERSNHIIRHIIRGVENPAGKYATSAVFGFAGFCIWMSLIGTRARTLSVKNVIMFFPCVLMPYFIGSGFARRRFGDRREAKKFNKMCEDSLENDEKFYKIVDNIKKENMKH